LINSNKTLKYIYIFPIRSIKQSIRSIKNLMVKMGSSIKVLKKNSLCDSVGSQQTYANEIND